MFHSDRGVQYASTAFGAALAQIRAAVFDYLEAFYNRQRAHSALGYLSPSALENQKQ